MKKFTAFIAVIVTALSVSAMPALSAGVEMDENVDNRFESEEGVIIC